jgi:hypothetical protein
MESCVLEMQSMTNSKISLELCKIFPDEKFGHDINHDRNVIDNSLND